jgi:hypothetical protein
MQVRTSVEERRDLSARPDVVREASGHGRGPRIRVREGGKWRAWASPRPHAGNPDATLIEGHGEAPGQALLVLARNARWLAADRCETPRPSWHAVCAPLHA